MSFPSLSLTIQISSDNLLKWNLGLFSIWKSLSQVSHTHTWNRIEALVLCQAKTLYTSRELSSRRRAEHCHTTSGSGGSPGCQYTEWFNRPPLCQPSFSSSLMLRFPNAQLIARAHFFLLAPSVLIWICFSDVVRHLFLDTCFEAVPNYPNLLSMQT